MTETEKQLAYHRHELNRFRLMGYQDCLANVHRVAIERLTLIQKHGPVLSDIQAQHVMYWMCQRRSVLKEQITKATVGVNSTLTSAYTEWLIYTVKDCQCDMKTEDWGVVLEFLNTDPEAFNLSLPLASMGTTIRHNIERAIACPA
ncbi:hypothetical protein [Aeromonas phage Asp37]|nr:hypothetical protein [Aeromonas phage Asp37]